MVLAHANSDGLRLTADGQLLLTEIFFVSLPILSSTKDSLRIHRSQFLLVQGDLAGASLPERNREKANFDLHSRLEPDTMGGV